jgi:hypothetical protein
MPDASSLFLKTITNLEAADNNALKAPYVVALRTLTKAFTNPFRHLYFKYYRDVTFLNDMPPNYMPKRLLSGAPPCYCTDGGLVRMRLTRGSSERASSTALASWYVAILRHNHFRCSCRPQVGNGAKVSQYINQQNALSITTYVHVRLNDPLE